MPTSSSVLSELRRARRIRRLGELEWFEVAYRVYLAALFGGLAVMWLSDLVTDEPVTPAQLSDVAERGPAVLGLLAIGAVALGLRSGSDGGPVSLEAGDARHLMLAPIPRRDVLLRPVGQRMRAVAFAAGIAGAIAGQLASRRLPGSAAAWAASGGAAAALAGLAFVAAAVLAHAFTVPRWASTAIGAVLLVAQAAAAVEGWPGPADRLGSLAMWGWRTNAADLAAAAVIVAAGSAALFAAGRLRIEPLTRRADLVSQLHFAVTMQDLRTVVLLRRQLRGERPRSRPWVKIGATASGATASVVRRGLRGLARYPASRLARMAALAVLAGIATVAVVRGTTPAVLAVGVALHLLGLDAIEPLSQEIDHPDVADGVPRQRGWLLLRHLAAALAAVVPFAFIGAATVAALEPAATAAAMALALPTAAAGACGSIVSVVRDAADPAQSTPSAVPPEFAGAGQFLRLAVPVAISTVPAVAAVFLRQHPEPATAVRLVVLDLLLIAATAVWVRRRDEWLSRWRRFLEAGRRTA